MLDAPQRPLSEKFDLGHPPHHSKGPRVVPNVKLPFSPIRKITPRYRYMYDREHLPVLRACANKKLSETRIKEHQNWCSGQQGNQKEAAMMLFTRNLARREEASARLAPHQHAVFLVSLPCQHHRKQLPVGPSTKRLKAREEG